MSLEAYQQRVVDEKQELDSKLDKLRAFLKTDTALGMPFLDRNLMVEQERVMTKYSDVLAERINRFFERGDPVSKGEKGGGEKC